MKFKELAFEFVENVPEDMKEGILYISTKYASAMHKCCCGCGSEVVTPLSPAEWALTFDGETVSLEPSIGNWDFPCRSHYWILRNKVKTAPAWSTRKVDAGRAEDKADMRKYLDRKTKAPNGRR